MFPLGAAISAGADLLGGAMQAAGQRATNRQARDNMITQMQFQELMSSSAHQREVKDLKAAGLNPILSASGGGAASAVGASAALGNPNIGIAQGLSKASSSAQQYNTYKKQLELIEEEARTQRSIQGKNNADAARSRLEGQLLSANFSDLVTQMGLQTKAAQQSYSLLKDSAAVQRLGLQWEQDNPWSVRFKRFMENFNPFLSGSRDFGGALRDFSGGRK